MGFEGGCEVVARGLALGGNEERILVRRGLIKSRFGMMESDPARWLPKKGLEEKKILLERAGMVIGERRQQSSSIPSDRTSTCRIVRFLKSTALSPVRKSPRGVIFTDSE